MPSDHRAWTKVFRPAPATSDVEAHADALESQISEQFAGRKRIAPAPRRPWLRIALAGLLAAGVGVGACQIPTAYERRLGQRIAIVLPAGEMTEVDVEGVALYVERNYPIEGMAIAVHISQDDAGQGQMRIAMDVVGPDIDIEVVWDDLRDTYPMLEGGRVEEEAMEGVVHGTWGGRLGNELFDLAVDRGDVDEARRQLLQQLRAQGLEGAAEITIEDEETLGGLHRRVEVRVETEDDAL